MAYTYTWKNLASKAWDDPTGWTVTPADGPTYPGDTGGTGDDVLDLIITGTNVPTSQPGPGLCSVGTLNYKDAGTGFDIGALCAASTVNWGTEGGSETQTFTGLIITTGNFYAATSMTTSSNLDTITANFYDNSYLDTLITGTANFYDTAVLGVSGDATEMHFKADEYNGCPVGNTGTLTGAVFFDADGVIIYDTISVPGFDGYDTTLWVFAGTASLVLQYGDLGGGSAAAWQKDLYLGGGAGIGNGSSVTGNVIACSTPSNFYGSITGNLYIGDGGGIDVSNATLGTPAVYLAGGANCSCNNNSVIIQVVTSNDVIVNYPLQNTVRNGTSYAGKVVIGSAELGAGGMTGNAADTKFGPWPMNSVRVGPFKVGNNNVGPYPVS